MENTPPPGATTRQKSPVLIGLSENQAKNLQNGDGYIAQIPDFEMEYLENHWAHCGR